MTFVSASQFHVYLPWVNACFAQCLNNVLNVKALGGNFNQEMALVVAFYVIVKTDGSFAIMSPTLCSLVTLYISWLSADTPDS